MTDEKLRKSVKSYLRQLTVFRWGQRTTLEREKWRAIEAYYRELLAEFGNDNVRREVVRQQVKELP